MRKSTVLERLGDTKIRMEEDFATPENGQAVQLDYMVVRSDDIQHSDDRGRVQWTETAWVVALFTANKKPELETKIRRALCMIPEVEITHFPDGSPYQTNFTFTTKQIGGTENG